MKIDAEYIVTVLNLDEANGYDNQSAVSLACREIVETYNKRKGKYSFSEALRSAKATWLREYLKKHDDIS